VVEQLGKLLESVRIAVLMATRMRRRAFVLEPDKERLILHMEWAPASHRLDPEALLFRSGFPAESHRAVGRRHFVGALGPRPANHVDDGLQVAAQKHIEGPVPLTGSRRRERAHGRSVRAPSSSGVDQLRFQGVNPTPRHKSFTKVLSTVPKSVEMGLDCLWLLDPIARDPTYTAHATSSSGPRSRSVIENRACGGSGWADTSRSRARVGTAEQLRPRGGATSGPKRTLAGGGGALKRPNPGGTVPRPCHPWIGD
jgi:hypothetical protein